MRDSNPLYDLLGGYYPGDPIPQRRYYGNYPTPLDIDSDALINNYLYEVEKELDKFSLSAAKKNLFLDDLERALRARASPKPVGYDPMRAMELGDEEDVAGIQVQLDINPIKWVEDPGEMIKKQGKQFVKDFVNWSDYSSYVERKDLWTPLLEGSEVSPLVEYAYGEHLEGVPLPGPKPFQLVDLGIHTTEEKEFYDHQGNKTTLTRTDADLFSQSAGSFKNFTRTARAYGPRDAGFRGFANQAAIASSAELAGLLESGKITDPKQIKEVKSHLHRARLLRAANAIHNKEDSNRYVFTKSGEFSDFGHGIGKGLKSLSSDLSELSFGNKDAGAVKKTIDSVLGDGSDSSLTKLKNIYANAEAHFSGLGPTELAEFRKNFKPLQGMIKEAEQLKGSLEKKSFTGLIGKGQAADFAGRIDYITKKYAGEGAMKGGLNNMNRRFLENDFLHGGIRDVVFDSQNRSIVGTRRLMNVSDEVMRFYKREDFYDLINMYEKNGLIGIAADVTWNLVRARLNGFTPAEMTREFLKRKHYFGLMYNDDYGPRHGRDNRLFNRIIHNSRISKWFDNDFELDVIIAKGIKTPDVKKTLKLKGDKSLTFGLNAWGRTRIKGTQHLSQEDLIDLINFKERVYGELVSSGRVLRYGGKSIDDARKNSAYLRAWLKRHNEQLGLKFDKKGLLINSKDNQKRLDSLFDALRERQKNPNLLSVTAQKAGLLEKVSQKVNVAQEKAFRWFYKTKVGKLVSGGAYIREVIAKTAAKAINSAISKILSSAIVAGTEGIGAIIYPIIEKAVQYVLNKVEDSLRKLGKALLQADIDIIEEFVEESTQSLVKLVGILALVFIVPTAFFTYTIAGVLSSITPVDFTRRNAAGPQDYVSGRHTPSGPPVDCPPGECIVVSTQGCFEFVGNWDSGGAAQALPVLQSAADRLANEGGNYVNRLCAGGRITVQWDPDFAWCGRIYGSDAIYFGDSACWSYISGNQSRFDHLFAHETGHLYNRRFGYGNYSAAKTADCGNTLSTYVGTDAYECSYNHSSSDEDFAEIVGNYISILRDCENIPGSWDEFWRQPGPHNNYCPNAYRGHLEFAESSFLFGP